METQIVEIRVETDEKLTEDEMWIISTDFMHRLEGYTTKMPKELINANITLVPIIKNL